MVSYRLLPFGLERCDAAGLAGACPGLAVRVSVPHSPGRLPLMRQVPLAFPWFYCVLSMILLVFTRFRLLLLASGRLDQKGALWQVPQVPLAFPCFYCVRSLILLVFTRFCLLLLASCRSDQKGAPPQVPQEYNAFNCVVKVIILVYRRFSKLILDY